MAENTLFAKIAAVVTKVDEVAKKGHNDHFHYDYATAEDVLRALRGPLAESGVALFCSLSEIEERAYKTSRGNESVITTAHVTFTFADGESGEQFKCPWAGQGDDPADKGLGKAYTNAVKTFLRQTFLLPQGDDPEADSSTDQRSAERASSGPRVANAGGKPSEKQLKYLKSLIAQHHPLKVQITAVLPGVEVDEGWTDKLSKGQCSTLIEAIKDGNLPPVPETPVPASDIPEAAPDEFVHQPSGDTSPVPIDEAA